MGYRKLKPGPRLSREAVADDQSRRLRGAMIDIVDQQGYAATTVKKLCRTAGVSRDAFYQNFPGSKTVLAKETCYLAAFDTAMRCAASRFDEGVSPDQSLRSRLEGGFLSLAAAQMANERVARFLLLEPYRAGRVGLRALSTSMTHLANLIAKEFSRESGGGLSPILAAGVAAGAASISRRHLLGRSDVELTRCAPEIATWALRFRSGASRRIADDLPGLGVVRFSPERPAVGDAVLSAALEIASRDGVRGLSVTKICATSQVRRSRFEERFEDAESCLQEGRRALGEALLEAFANLLASREWAEGLAVAMTAFCELLAAEPALAGLAIVDILALGPAAAETEAAFLDQVVSLILERAPVDQTPPRTAMEASVAAVWQLIQRAAVRGELNSLSREAALLAYLLLTPALGADDACAVAVGLAPARGRS